MKLKIKAWRKLRDRIASEPLSYDQRTWYTSRSPEIWDNAPPCGTVACLAGEAIIANAPSTEEGVAQLRENDLYGNVPEVAAEILGFSYFKHSGVFNADASGWPEQFRRKLKRARTIEGKAKAALAYVDWVIENKKVQED